MGEDEKQTDEQRGLDLLAYVRTFAHNHKVKTETDIDELFNSNEQKLSQFMEFAMEITGVFDDN